MDKKILEHEKFIKSEIKKIETALSNTKDKKEISQILKMAKKLYKFHREAVRNFQHERQIHLIVTIFFASMQIFAIAATIFFSSITATSNIVAISTLMIIIDLILFITGIFYVRHYYLLENGTQRLYEFSKKLYQITTMPN